MQKKEPNRLFFERSEANDLEYVYDDKPIRQAAVRTQLLGGLRISEASEVRAGDVVESDKGVHRLRVRNGKGDKMREAVIPERLAEQLRTIAKIQDTEGEIFDVTTRTIRNWVYDAAEQLAEETGNDDWRDVKPHDLRRYYCSHLVREGFAAAEVMEWSGHEDYSTFRDHYWLPSDDVVSSKLKEADF
jgi:integrase